MTTFNGMYIVEPIRIKLKGNEVWRVEVCYDVFNKNSTEVRCFPTKDMAMAFYKVEARNIKKRVDGDSKTII